MKSAVKRIGIPISNQTGGEFEALPYIKRTVNFKIKNGALVDAVGFKPARIGRDGSLVDLPDLFTPLGMYSAVTSGGERLLVCGRNEANGDGAVYVFDPDRPEIGFTPLEGADCERVSFAAVRRSSVVGVAFTPGDGRLFFYDGTSLTVTSCPPDTVDLCTFRDRLIALTVNTLYVSTEDVLHFEYDESSEFALPDGVFGKRCAVFGNELIIVGTRGLARLTVIDFGRTFYLRPVCTGVERLFPETMAAGGHGIYLLSENGLAVFEGVELVYSMKNSVYGITEGLGGFFSGGDYHACVKTTDIAQKQVVLSYVDGGAYLSDAQVISSASWDSGRRTLVLLGDRHGIFEVGNGYCSPAPIRRAETCTCNFESRGQKVVSAFSIRTEGDVLLRITADGRPHVFPIKGGRGERTVCPYLTGREFSFEIIYEGIGAHLSHPTVTVEHLREGL